MKKLWIVAVLLLVLVTTGCMTKNQLDGEKAYYQMLTALRTQQANQPIFKMTPSKEGEPIVLGNVGSIEVYSQRMDDKIPSQYVHQDFGVKRGLDVVSGAVLPIVGAVIVKSVVDGVQGNTTNYSQTVTGENNTGRIAGPSNITANAAGNSNTFGGAVEMPTTTTTNTPSSTTITTNTTTTPTTTTTTNTDGRTTTGNVTQ